MPYGSIAAAYFALWFGVRVLKLSTIILHDVAVALDAEVIAKATQYFLWSIRPENGSRPFHGWDSVIFVAYFSVVMLVPLWWLIERRSARGALYRHRTTMRVLDALHRCAEAYDRPPGERASQLRDLDAGLRAAEKAILRAHRYAGTIPNRSPRRAAVRTHTALVAGALRSESLKIDADPDVALPRLGTMLAIISERCAEGRIGALLPEAYLEGVPPVSLTRTAIRESVHVAVVITTAMAAAVGASMMLPTLGLSQDLRPWLIVGCSVLAAILVGGWHRVGRLLELVPGK
ncbi:hypothetical protein [Streptomyces sp. NPDC093591]|uniref:hypothetical protein n=1 Tax=Streptomyces sp. NPDC093591 TaxID=3366044 RepID=UPI00382E165D